MVDIQSALSLHHVVIHLEERLCDMGEVSFSATTCLNQQHAALGGELRPRLDKEALVHVCRSLFGVI